MVFLFVAYRTSAQECVLTLSGHIQDKDTKEHLAGASVNIVELGLHFVTDALGDFRYDRLCAGEYTIEVSHVGCEPIRQQISLSKNRHLDILMPHVRNNLQTVIVEATRPGSNGGYKAELNAKELELSKGSSLAEVLSKINGVNILHAGSTIAKPVIHGLHSVRVLTINNGVRQEGQQWGNEHAPEIDTYIADKVSVIKGVDELKYGSDAIGGVVLIDPKPIKALPGASAELNTAYFTNNNQYVVSGIFEHKLEKLPAFSYRVNGTLKKAANVRTPSYRLNNTGLSELSFSAAANWVKEHYQLEAYYSEFATEIGIFTGSHIGNERDLLNIIEHDKPDDVFLGENTYSIKRPQQEVVHRLFKLKSTVEKNNHEFNLTLAGQYNHRNEYDIVRNPNNTDPQVSLAILTFSEELSYTHPAIHGVRGTLGLSLMQQDNSYSGRYLIPDYFSGSYGAYWIEKWTHNKLDLEAGFRFDNKGINTHRLKYGGEEIDHDFHFTTFASSFNVGYRIGSTVRWNAGLSFSTRAPHVNELLIDGIHEGAGIYEQGDINLKPEKAVDVFSGIKYDSRKKDLSAEAQLYYNHINDFIYQQPVPGAPVSTIVGTFPLRKYMQTDAVLTGADLSILYHLDRHISWSSKASILFARNMKIDDWLILMPADRWSNEITYSFRDHPGITDASVGLELASIFKPRVPSDRNGKQDYKAPPDGYMLVNMNASATVSIARMPVTIGLSVTNLLNTAYRDYLNSFRYYTDEMGRNIALRIKLPFKNLFHTPSPNHTSVNQ